jgi:hypothetical protein
MCTNEYFLVESTKYDIKQNDTVIIFKIRSSSRIDLENDLGLGLKFLKNGNMKILIGFSINMKEIKITYKEEVFQINSMHCLNIFTEINETLYIEPCVNTIIKQLVSFEIYVRIENFNCLTENIVQSICAQNPITIGLNSKKPIKKIIILLTRIIKSIGDYFKKIFEKRGIDCELIYKLKPTDCFDFFYKNDWILLVLFFNESHLLLPNRVIYYQIEQKNSIFLTEDKKLKRTLYIMEKSEKVWDFMKNARYIYEKDYYEKLFMVPMPFVKYEPENMNSIKFEQCKYDLFFYGNPNHRRKNILELLSKQFNVKIGFETYGDEKLKLLSESKIILNLHYYKEAGLETCRLNEILNYKKIIISEKSNLDKDNMILYKDLVVFVDEIDDKFENTEQLVKHINFYLKKSNYIKFTEKFDYNLDVLEKKIEQSIVI